MLRDVRRVQHLAAEIFELELHRGSTSREGEEEVVVLAGMKLRLRVFVEVTIAFEAGVEAWQAAGEFGAIREIAEAGDQRAAFAKMPRYQPSGAP